MYRKTTLNNGVRIVTEVLPHLESVSLGIWVNTGSRDELGHENGVSHFVEHMSFKGTVNRTALEIARELDAIGGLSNAFTGKENTCFHGRVLGRHFGRLADILSDIFVNPVLNPEDVEREREVIFQEILMMEDSPDDYIHTLFQEILWPDHPIGRSILGTGETVAGIGKEAILDYLHRAYTPDRVLVAAAGQLDHDQVVSFFQEVFDRTSPGSGTVSPRTAPGTTRGRCIHSKELEQVHICLGGEAPSQMDETRFASAIMNTHLGGNMSSRLFQEIRENRGLAYSIYSFVSAYVDTGMLGIYAATESRHLHQVLELVQQEIKNLCRGEVSGDELSRAKEHLIGSIFLSSEGADSRMMRLAKNEFAFGRQVSHEELAARLEQVSLEEVVDIAREIFQGSGVSMAVLGPVTEQDVEEGLLDYA